jgi:hypothetical protein
MGNDALALVPELCSNGRGADDPRVARRIEKSLAARWFRSAKSRSDGAARFHLQPVQKKQKTVRSYESSNPVRALGADCSCEHGTPLC